MKISLAAPAAFELKLTRRVAPSGTVTWSSRSWPVLERGGVGDAQGQAVHRHGQQVGGRRGLARGRHAGREPDLVEDVGPDEDVVRARGERGQARRQRAGVRCAGLERALVRDGPEVDVGDVPGRPGAEVDGVRPAPGAGLSGLLSWTVQLTVNGSPDFTVGGLGSVMPVTIRLLGGGGSMTSGGARNRLLLSSLRRPRTPCRWRCRWAGR